MRPAPVLAQADGRDRGGRQEGPDAPRSGRLSTHTVAFHLRHIVWKLGITSRVHLARIAAEQGAEDAS